MQKLNILTPKTFKALSFLEESQEKILKLLRKIALTPSPTFFERQKAVFLKKELADLGLSNTYIDKCGNLRGYIDSGKSKKKNILTVAHLDTVLKPKKKIKETKNYLFGHGVCDNGAGIVSLVAILHLIKKFDISFPGRLYFAFTVGEEGLGGKKGMKFVAKNIKDISAVVNMESHDIGRITNQSIGQYRVKIDVEAGENGHSWRDFDGSGANVILSFVVSRLAQAPGFKKGRLTFNVGRIEGGEGINIIAGKAFCLLEMRAINQEALEKAENKLKKIISDVIDKYPQTKIKACLLSETKASFFPKNHKLYRLTKEAQGFLRIKSFFHAGNSDGDISLGKNIPTVTLGSSFGFKTHSFDEYLDKNSLILGIKQNFLVLLNVLVNF